MNKNDLRRFRTKINLERALLKLLKKRSLNEVKIKELTELAMVSRQTFYLHYETIEGLFEACIKRILDEIHEETDRLVAKSDNELVTRDLMVEAFRIYYKHKEDLKILFKVANKDLLIEAIYKNYHSQRLFNDESYQDEVLYRYSSLNFVGGFYMILKEWILVDDSMTPGEFTDLFVKVMNR